MILRDFNISDHEEVFLVAKESWNLAYSKNYTKEFLENRLNDWYSLNNHNGMIARIKTNELLFKVYIENEEIIGFISGNIKEGCLQRLYIKPAYTRQGIGLFLLDFFIEELTKNSIKTCMISCDKNNSIGLNFYIKNGFIIKGEDEEDYLLVKNIS